MNLISAVIITYNEEKNIARCLDSIRMVADEIIVLDGYSSDRTVEIARSKGANVKQGYFLGYIQQKNSAISLASNDYILSLDADEALDENLVNCILDEKKNFAADAYYMSRCTNYCGKFIRRGTWYPDKKIRLFDRRVAAWGGTNLHEKIDFHRESRRIGYLKGDILHYSFPTIQTHLEKNDKYSSIAAQTLYSKGKKSSWFKILINPFWAFIHGFIIRLGFLDGFHGFVISINTAHATFLKYTKLYELQHTPQVKTQSRSNRSNNILLTDQVNTNQNKITP
ncbi:MAG: glycosyltransferase family 2 protein [Chitinophagaceae bacterium]